MDRSFALKHKNLLYAALNDLLRNRVRSAVVVLCLTAILLPVATALSISEGLRSEAEISLRHGPDVSVSSDRYGANGPVSLGLLDNLAALEGVKEAVPRVLGRTYFVDRLIAVAGLARGPLSSLRPLVRGHLPVHRGDVVIGHGIAEQFGVKAGMPFTLAANNRKVLRATGTLFSSCLWGSDVMIMHIDDANEFFRMKGRASQFLLYTSSPAASRPASVFADRSMEDRTVARGLRIEDRRSIREQVRRGYNCRGGIFSVLLVIGGALAVPAFLITSGIGLRDARREIGILKAIGWKTGDVIEKVALENLAVALAAACLSILLSMAWMKLMNGMLIAQFYVSEVGLLPGVDIPSRTLPSHALVLLVFALVVTQIAGLISVGARALRPPTESMR